MAIGLINYWIKEEDHVQVFVRDNNVDQALRALKKKMQREGVFREMKLRSHYEKPSERRVREKAEAIRRARKLARKKLQREGLLPMKPRVVQGTVGRGRPAAAKHRLCNRDLIGLGTACFSAWLIFSLLFFSGVVFCYL